MGLNFYHHDSLQPKNRAGIINEHECKKHSIFYDSSTNQRILNVEKPKYELGFPTLISACYNY